MSDNSKTDEPRLTPAQALEAAKNDLTKAESDKVNLQDKVTQLEADLQASEELATEVQGKLDDLQSKFDELKTTADADAAKVTSLEAEKTALETKNADLEAKEQDIEKRATSMLAAKQAALGDGGPLATGSPDNKDDSETKNLTGYDRALAARKAKAAQSNA